MSFRNIPDSGSSSWKDSVANAAALPTSGNGDGDARVTLDDQSIYIWKNGTSSWVQAATPAETSAITALLGDVSAVGPGAVSSTIQVGAVTDAKASLSNKPAITAVATSNLTLSGAQTIDGQLTVAGTSIVLATAQTTGSQNGPWVVQSGAWTRPSWYPSGGTTQGIQFSTTLVRLGTTYQGSTWRLTTAAPITIDTTATTWAVTPLAVNGSTTTVANNLISNSMLSQMPAHTYKGNNTGSTANALDLTISQVKTDLSLNNVDNTSDANKPVSTAQQAEFDATWFGDGSDGNLTISSGATIIQVPTYYNTLTINGTGKLAITAPIFVETLDLSNAPALSITALVVSGNPATTSTGGTGGGASAQAFIPNGVAGGNGATSTTTNGAQAAASANGVNGGVSGAGGAGGNGNSGTGGISRAMSIVTNAFNLRYPSRGPFARGLTAITIGSGAPGGSSGAGDGTAGGGGGGGGAGGSMIAIFAKNIILSPSTASGAINSPGGAGGNGATPGAGSRGGGGGGAGGGGGWVYLVYSSVTNTGAPSDVVRADGGAGGNGGNGSGSGLGGDGGGGGANGRINLINIRTGVVQELLPGAGSPAGGGNAASGITGGTGGTAGSGGLTPI